MDRLFTHPAIQNAALAAARVLLAAIFLISGYGKITGYAATQAYMQKAGVPGALLPLVILTEVGGGLLILIGWQTRLAALALCGFTFLSALFFHASSDPGQQINLLKNLAMCGGFLALFAAGAGAWSLDGAGARSAAARPNRFADERRI